MSGAAAVFQGARPPGTLWCERAWLGGDAAVEGVLLTIDGGRIVTVQPGAEPGGERLSGLTLPGLANAHSHAFQRALRGRTQVGTGSFWTWREQMYELAATLDPDGCLALARATFAEMALAGVTCVGEFHYLHHAPDGTPYDDPNAMGAAIVAAAREAGIRLTLLDTCYLHGGIDRFRDADADAWAARVSALADDDMVRVGAAIHSVRAVDPEAARIVAEWAASGGATAGGSGGSGGSGAAAGGSGAPGAAAGGSGAAAGGSGAPGAGAGGSGGGGPAGGRPLHAHVSEQPGENEWCMREYGRTPTSVLADAGAISPAFTAVHATHLTDRDVDLLRSATVCLCPTTERDLADGIGPAAHLSDAGAALAVGSDSHAVIDLFEEARAIELNERLATGVRGVHAAVDLLRAATNHACLGWPDAGRLEAGALADLITVRTDSVRTAGAEPIQGAVFAAAATDVRDVMVGGQWIVRDGAHVRLDVAAELGRAL